MKGESNIQTGDINLAAAIMACAIPLVRECPVRVIEHDGAKPYASFSLSASSNDGKHITEKLMAYWGNSEGLHNDHPFAKICSFIKARPDGRLSAGEWLDHAVDYLTAQGVALPGLRRIEDIDAFVTKFPTLVESYILAFVANRSVCLNLYHAARRAVFMRRDEASALIDSQLPVWQRNELLSRLQG